MENKISYEQYNKLDWKNQEKTEMNSMVNDRIIDYILAKNSGSALSLFDIGFGIGFLLRTFADKAKGKYQTIHLEGCEPAEKSYEHFSKKLISGVTLKTYATTFLDAQTSSKFDAITAVYVLPVLSFEDLEPTVKKIYSMLNPGGRFLCILTGEASFKAEKNDKDLFNLIEKKERIFDGKSYTELYHKSMLPGIGYVYDYNRDQKLYEDMFTKNGFVLEKKEDINDGYFLNAFLVFQKP